MRKTLIAGLAALSLSVTPVAAQDAGFQQDDLGKAIFALIALGVIGKAISNSNNSSGSDHVAVAPPVVRHDPVRIAPDRGGLRDDRRPHWGDSRGGRVAPAPARSVPHACLRSVETRFGTQRMFGRNCLQNNHRAFARLPARCEVRVFTRDGSRQGFDPACLRQEGYQFR